LILATEETPDEVAQRFADIDQDLEENFRDPSSTGDDIGLTLRDCWGSLYHGKQFGWIGMQLPSPPQRRTSRNSGRDSHRIQRDLDGSPYEDRASGSRIFCPKYIASLLHDMDVFAVIQLNAVEYDCIAFLQIGIRHHDLYYSSLSSSES
jgi:hypothetical protein